MSAPRLQLAGALLVLVLVLGCATGGRLGGGATALRISEVADEGDATRGFAAAGARRARRGRAGRRGAALSHYERAIQIDATNPYAYLALACHEIEAGDPVRALEYLNQAEILLESENARSRGSSRISSGCAALALRATGAAGDGDLEQARRLAPEVWGDGRLTPAELR